MTPKQVERIQAKIKKIKAELAADKKRWGGFYDDSRGIRYMPLELYIKIEDYSGGLRYMNWFNKNFPEDCGFPEFLFEWTIILYKNGKFLEAEKKAFQTFCSNTYVLDKYFSRPIVAIDKYEGSNIETTAYTENFNYSQNQIELADFTKWLRDLVEGEKFKRLFTKYLALYKLLKDEHEYENRHKLITEAGQLKNDI